MQRGDRQQYSQAEKGDSEAERLQAFMQHHAGANEAESKKRPVAEQYRAPNQHVVQAVDHALHGGLGIRLAAFVVHRPPSPLTRTQKRYFIDAADLPGWKAVSSDDPPGRLKACFEDSASGQRWVEVPSILRPDGSLNRPALHITQDYGPIGTPATHWLFGHARLRGTFADDWCHSMWNIFEDACRRVVCVT